MTIGEKIKKLRIHTGLTQRALGELSGTSETTIKQYELGKRQPRIEQLKNIAKVFDFPLYLLLDDNFELENVELEMKRVRPFKSYEMTEPPEPFTIPMSSSRNDTTLKLHTNSDAINWEQLDDMRYKSLMRKLDNGENLTQEENKFKSAYLERALRKIGDILAKFYSMLNVEGQKKADEQIDRAIEQIELLTKIPEYQKKLPEPPEE